MITGMFARSVVGALGLFVAFASSGHAAVVKTDVLYHGSLCNPVSGDVTLVEYSEFGVHNASDSRSVDVHCGGAIETRRAIATTSSSPTIDAVTVFIFDRNSDAGADVSCTLRVMDVVGGVLFTGTQSSPVPAQSGFQQLDFSPGTTGATIDLACSIPPLKLGSRSHVHAYAVTTAVTTP